MKKNKNNLGFKYSKDVSDLVDADEYRELLRSGKLTEAEAEFMKQFLKEYYGRPSKSQLKVHDPDKHHKSLQAADSRRERDIHCNPQTEIKPKEPKARHTYDPSDYRKESSSPEDILILKEELQAESNKK